MPDAAPDKRAFSARFKYSVGSASAAVEFMKREVKAKALFIKVLGLSSQGIVISLRCDISIALRTIMTAVTWYGNDLTGPFSVPFIPHVTHLLILFSSGRVQ